MRYGFLSILTLLLPLFMFTGCSSIESSQRLSLAIPAKTNPSGASTTAQYYWTDKPYITPVQDGFSALPMKGKFVRLQIDDTFCGNSTSKNTMPDDDDAADVLIHASWKGFGKEKLINVVDSLKETAYAPNMVGLLQTPSKTTASQVVGTVISVPIYITAGVILAPLYVITGEAFRDKEPGNIEKRKAFVAKKRIMSDDEVYYALLKIQLINRKDQLLFPVNTPSKPEDWEAPLEYTLILAVVAPDPEQGKMALCGIPTKTPMP